MTIVNPDKPVIPLLSTVASPIPDVETGMADELIPSLPELNSGASIVEALPSVNTPVFLISSQELTDEEIIRRAESAMHQLAEEIAEELDLNKDELKALLPKPQLMDEEDLEDHSHLNGAYRSTDHSIFLNQVRVRNHSFKHSASPEFVVRHEAMHALEAAIRGELGQERIKDILLDQICDEIKNGAPVVIADDTAIGQFEPPCIVSPEIRNLIADFQKEVLLAEDSSGIVEDNSLGGTIHCRKLSDEGKEELIKRLKEKNSSFQEVILNLGLSEENSIYLISKWIDANIFRYDLNFGKNRGVLGNITLPDNLKGKLNLSSKARDFAEQSTKERLYCSDGNAFVHNYKKLGMIANKAADLAYSFAPEEARNNLRQAAFDERHMTSESQRIEIDARRNLYFYGDKLMQLRRRFSLAPKDQTLYSKWLKHCILKQRCGDTTNEFWLKTVDCLCRLAESGKIITSKEIKSKEQIEMRRLIEKLHGLPTDPKLTEEEKLESGLQERIEVVKRISELITFFNPEQGDEAAELIRLAEESKNLILETGRQCKSFEERTFLTLEIDCLDKSHPANIALVREIHEAETQIMHHFSNAVNAGVQLISSYFESVSPEWLAVIAT